MLQTGSLIGVMKKDFEKKLEEQEEKRVEQEEKMKEEEEKLKEDFEEKMEEQEERIEAAVARGETRFLIIKHQLNLTSGIDDAKAEAKRYTNSEDKKLEAKIEASHASQGKHFCVVSRQLAKQPPSLRVPHVLQAKTLALAYLSYPKVFNF